MTDSSKKNTQENELDMSKIWSYIRCYFYVIFGYHFLFLVEESTGEKFYNVWSGYFIIASILLMLVLYFCKGESVNSILSFFKNQLKWIFCIVLCVVSIIYVFNFFSVKEFCHDFFQPIKFLELNDLGDFLSGVFAPLAFVFLYLSYKQLQQQLKIANDTLDEQKKQAEEQLKIAHRTLEEQKKQAKESEEYLKQQVKIANERLQLDTLPILYIPSSSKDSYSFVLRNEGEIIMDVEIFGKKDSEIIIIINKDDFFTKDSIIDLSDINGKITEGYVTDFIINHPELSEKVKDNIYKIKLYIKFKTKLYTCYQITVDFYYKKSDDKPIKYYDAHFYKLEIIE